MAEEPSTAPELGVHAIIVAGVDGSVTSLRAGAYAAGLARRQGARLVCLYVEQHSALYGTASAAGAGLTAAEDEALTEIGEDLRGDCYEDLGFKTNRVVGVEGLYSRFKVSFSAHGIVTLFHSIQADSNLISQPDETARKILCAS